MPTGDPDYVDAANYSWNPGGTQSYDADNFFLPVAYFDPFQYANVNYSAPAQDREQAVWTTYTYDPYCLLVVGTVDPLDNQSQITSVDYHTHTAAKIQDINGNTSAIVVDALGMVVATGRSGKPGLQARSES